MKIRKYKYAEWDFKFGECGYSDYDKNIYTDLEGNPITGFLENFWYFAKNDQRNWQYVENGKRKGSRGLNNC